MIHSIQPTFIETKLDVAQVSDMKLTLADFERIQDYLLNKENKLSQEPWDQYDLEVQSVLDQFWPGCTELSAIKRIDPPTTKVVYTAMYEGAKVIVKSVDYSAELEGVSDDYMLFVNYEGEAVSVASYIMPGVVHSDDETKLVTMSKFAEGYEPKELPPNAPWSHATEEASVRAQGAWWRDFRARSIMFAADYPEGNEALPLWSEFQDGWQTWFTPVTIPITADSFGVVHGDAHMGNYMLSVDDESNYGMTMIDFDNAQRAWYMCDVGTVVWTTNMQYYFA